MGRTDSPSSEFVQPCDLLYLTIAEQKKQIESLEQWKKKAEREAEALNKSLASEKARREASEIEAAANLKALAKAQKVIQRQGNALIAEHYGISKYKLLLTARAILSTVPFMEMKSKSDRYPVDEENFRVCCANWFDDYEKEMRGIACDPKTT